MIDCYIHDVERVQLGKFEAHALYRLVSGKPKSRDRVILAEVIERSVARRKARENPPPISLDEYPIT